MVPLEDGNSPPQPPLPSAQPAASCSSTSRKPWHSGSAASKAVLELSSPTHPAAAASGGPAAQERIPAHGGLADSSLLRSGCGGSSGLASSPTVVLIKLSSVPEGLPLQLFGAAPAATADQICGGELLPVSQPATSPRSRTGSAAVEVGTAAHLVRA